MVPTFEKLPTSDAVALLLSRGIDDTSMVAPLACGLVYQAAAWKNGHVKVLMVPSRSNPSTASCWRDLVNLAAFFGMRSDIKWPGLYIEAQFTPSWLPRVVDIMKGKKAWDNYVEAYNRRCMTIAAENNSQRMVAERERPDQATVQYESGKAAEFRKRLNDWATRTRWRGSSSDLLKKYPDLWDDAPPLVAYSKGFEFLPRNYDELAVAAGLLVESPAS